METEINSIVREGIEMAFWVGIAVGVVLSFITWLLFG